MPFETVRDGVKRLVGRLCWMGVLVGLLTLPAARSAQASVSGVQGEIFPGLSFGGSLRMRYESQENFKFGASVPGDSQDYLLSQLRLNLTWKPGDHFKLFLQAQDSRVHTAFRDNTINDKKTPNIFADEFDLHQGYLDVNVTTGGRRTTVRVGRQKFNMGALRLIASLEWVNTARVWDGIRTTTKLGGGKTLDLIGSRLVPVRPEAFNTHAGTGSRLFNSRFHAIYYTDTAFRDTSRLEGYLLLRESRRAGDEVYTAGSRFAHKGKKWDVDGELARQFGTYGGLTQQAMMLHLGTGYSFGSGGTHLGVAYNYGSGDSDPNDGRHETFDNQFPLNHAYYGYMDFFSLQNVHNLELVVKRKLAKRVSARLALQHFRLVEEDSDAWYNAGAGVVRTAASDVDPTVGDEVDLTVNVMGEKKFGALIGYSHFFTGQYVTDTAGPDEDADFLFVQSKWTF